MLLKDKIILITGSTAGIGKAIATQCVAEGAKVMIHGLSETHAKEICQSLGAASQYILANLHDQTSYAKIVKATVDAFGAIHGLVNNAGIFPRSSIDTVDSASFDHVMTINTKAPLLITHEAVKCFRSQGTGGTIVNIGSINAYCGQKDLLLYAMSKGALMTMTRNLGESLGHEKIRVNQLNVGWVPTETEIALKKSEGFPEGWQDHVNPVFAPTGKLVSPEQVAEHAVFWLSDRSAPVNGSIYEVEQYPVIGRNRIADL